MLEVGRFYDKRRSYEYFDNLSSHIEILYHGIWMIVDGLARI